MEGAALVEDRVGITFGVELYVPWDAPEVVVQFEVSFNFKVVKVMISPYHNVTVKSRELL